MPVLRAGITRFPACQTFAAIPNYLPVAKLALCIALVVLKITVLIVAKLKRQTVAKKERRREWE
jgi:hypothetical protein